MKHFAIAVCTVVLLKHNLLSAAYHKPHNYYTRRDKRLNFDKGMDVES